MSDRNYSVLYWLSIAMVIFSAFMSMPIVGTIWMLIAAVYLVGGDIVKELRKK